MCKTLAKLITLAAAPALAADLPPEPRVGAPVEERLFLAADAARAQIADTDDLGLLAARIDCVAFQRARIDARIAAGLLARGWSAEADRLWRLSTALGRFEAVHIRPLIDADTQSAVLAAYAAEAPDDATRARRCLAFGDRFALDRVSG
jgi:hypothetical protein